MRQQKEAYEAEATPKKSGTDTLLIDLQEASGKVQLIVLCNWRRYFKFAVLLLRLQCGHFAHQRRVVLKAAQQRQWKHKQH